MPIFLEARLLGAGQHHLYLVYVPVGQENDYNAYRTIGGFPNTRIEAAPEGPWGNLRALYIDRLLSSIVDNDGDPTDDAYDVEGHADPRVWAEANRNSVQVYGAGGNDQKTDFEIWTKMLSVANNLDNNFTYLADATNMNGGIWGPTVNSNSLAVSVMLHTEQSENISLDVNQATVSAPGQHTWLGTSADDDMDMAWHRAQAAGINALYGGEGADTLSAEGLNIDTYLVAGDDELVDDVQGGGGTDRIVGYFNQTDLDKSDMLKGGGSDDHFIMVDPKLWLPGGIPNLEQDADALGSDYTHDGTPVGTGGLIDGGAGEEDTLDYQYVTGPVHLLLDDITIKNVEEILLTQLGDDFVQIQSIGSVNFIDGFQGRNTFSANELSDGVKVVDEPGLFDQTYDLEMTDGTGDSLELVNFDEWVLTNDDDDANFQLFDDQGNEVEGGRRITAYAADGLDKLIGTAT